MNQSIQNLIAEGLKEYTLEHLTEFIKTEIPSFKRTLLFTSHEISGKDISTIDMKMGIHIELKSASLNFMAELETSDPNKAHDDFTLEFLKPTVLFEANLHKFIVFEPGTISIKQGTS
jgi:hypothetical protein